MDRKTFQQIAKDEAELKLSPEEKEDTMEMLANYAEAGHKLCAEMDHVFDAALALMANQARLDLSDTKNFMVIKTIMDVGIGMGIEIGKEQANEQKSS